MKTTILKRLFAVVAGIVILFPSTNAQDPFMVHFHNNRSWYNPAFTGISGSAVISAKYKTQWDDTRILPFKTKYLSYEESLACQNIFDYGLQVLQDEEGAGRLRTWLAGAKLSGSFLLRERSYNTTTARFGITMQWGEKRIDFSQLSFADQLNAKYGLFDAFDNPNTSTFIIPDNQGQSKSFFAPAVGFLIQHVMEQRDSRKPIYLTLGGSLHNVLDLLGKRSFGNEESLLDIGTSISSRTTAHAGVEFYPFNRNGNIISIRPQMFFQSQGQLRYLETGIRGGWNNVIGLNVFYHSSRWKKINRVNTNWLSFGVEFNAMVDWSTKSAGRFDLGINYAIGVSGLKNSVGPIWELGIAYHLSYSPLCSSARNGKHDLRRGKNRHLCPEVSRGHRKLYENIWYKK